MSIPSNLPPTLKPISHFMKVATEHEVRDPVVAYWARFHAVQKALSLDKSTPEAKTFIVSLLGWLEGRKKDLAANEAITNEAVASAHVENYALKLFKYADDADRRGIFNKNTIKAFYTAAMLVDVLENFGEVGEEEDRMRKYGKWKAAHIHTCLKNGEMPQAGPPEGGGEDGEEWMTMGTNDDQPQPTMPLPTPPPQSNPLPQPAPAPQPQPTSSTTTTTLPLATLTTAQKYTKFASSALNFDDVPTAIHNLKKALHLLETGREMPE